MRFQGTARGSLEHVQPSLGQWPTGAKRGRICRAQRSEHHDLGPADTRALPSGSRDSWIPALHGILEAGRTECSRPFEKHEFVFAFELQTLLHKRPWFNSHNDLAKTSELGRHPILSSWEGRLKNVIEGRASPNVT